MKNLKILLAFIFVSSFAFSFAQNTEGKMDDKERLAIAVWIPDQIENLPAAAQNSLENKLNQILTGHGLSGSAVNSRFIITANVVMLTKTITPTSPPMQAYTLDVTFYIGDGIDGISFANYSMTMKGVGENETKAYMNAMKNIKTNDPGFQPFIEKAESRIIQYFNTRCDFIIQEAKSLEGQNQFDAAIWKLTSVPEACKDCWMKCKDAILPIFQKKINWECTQKLNEASNVWAAGQDYSAAEQAGQILSTIDPGAACFKEIKPLTERISKRLLEVDHREWKFTVDKEIGLERDRIKASRDVGVAYGNGQKAVNVTYKTLW